MDVILFCLIFAGFIYSYALYPVILFAVGLVKRSSLHRQPYTPPVSIIISAFNEAAVIGGKLENALSLDYPAERREILVISDSSTDTTDDIVKSYASRGVQLWRQSQRLGKTAGLNRGMELVSGKIVIFTDADALFEPDALRKMVSYFSDPTVGLVTGSTRYYADHAGQLVTTSSLYTRLERLIKELETRVGSCVGADGAIFGMRKSLYRPLTADDINDLVLPLQVVRQGFRAVFASDVFCREPASEDTRKEFLRQVRITNRTLDAIGRYAAMLNFRRYPLFSFQLISHKLLRFAVPFFMVALLGLNIQLLDRGAFFKTVLILQLASYVAAVLGWVLEKMGRPAGRFGFFFHFAVMNAAMLMGWYRFFSGRKDVTWDPRVT